jgi:hypothetical protein
MAPVFFVLSDGKREFLHEHSGPIDVAIYMRHLNIVVFIDVRMSKFDLIINTDKRMNLIGVINNFAFALETARATTNRHKRTR